MTMNINNIQFQAERHETSISKQNVTINIPKLRRNIHADN